MVQKIKAGILLIPLYIIAACFFFKNTPEVLKAERIPVAAQEIDTHEQEYTELYIINGDHEESGWFDGPSKSEFLRALMEYPQHLFITPSLWKSFCKHRNEQLKEAKKEKIIDSLENLEVKETTIYNTHNKKKKYSQNDAAFFNLATLLVFSEADWEFYDTHAGLYYLRPKDDIHDIGLKIETFTKIERPFETQCTISKKSWVSTFMDIFDINTWQQVHASGRKKIVCLSGHGTSRQHQISRACGIPTQDFIQLLLFFNDTLKINVLGVQTCYWPSQRILEAIAAQGKPYLDFQLITPIDQEKPVNYASEMPIVWSFNPDSKQTKIQEAQPGETLLIGLHDIATSFKGTMTEELSEKLQQVQVVQINHTYNMKSSLIDAGSSQPILI